MRIYIPATSVLLEQLVLEGSITVERAHAVTPQVREWYSGDEEELEYLAASAAARSSLELLYQSPEALRRRVVLAADSEAAPVDAKDLEGGHRSLVVVRQPISISTVAAALVDSAEAESDVSAALVDLPRALTNADARFAVDQAQSHELQWFAVQELPFIF